MSYSGAFPLDINSGGTGSTTGALQALSGDITAAVGSFIVLTAGQGITVGGGASVISGTGDPNGGVTAAHGSLYLRLDGSTSSTRAYINSDAGTTWIAVTTAT